MLLIISEELDPTTSEVILWLVSMGKTPIRINCEDGFSIIGLNPELNSIEIQVNNRRIDLDSVKSFWYRNGTIECSFFRDKTFIDSIEGYPAGHVLRFLSYEWIVIKDFVITKLESLDKVLGSYSKTRVNKLNVLFQASQCGLQIPSTYISSQKENIESFINRNKYITKPISEIYPIQVSNTETLQMFTSEINFHDVETRKETFFPSLIQEQIDKWIEIRIYFIGEKFYSMAIFSQQNSKTKEDFRKYDYNNMNRMVPFRIPDEILEKLKFFVKRISLNTGSIDMIITNSREYIFLEINPAGNIDMISKPCNYPIEKEIAFYLEK